MNLQNLLIAPPQSFRVDISIVVPLFNESESLPELVAQIYQAVQKSSFAEFFGKTPSFEILFINDGSTDGSEVVIKKLLETHLEIKLISFRKNYGKSAGLDVGFKTASGRYVITMDADLQDNPYEIEALIRKLAEGYDLVSGWKKKRYDPLSKTLPSKLFNFVTGLVSGVHIHDFNCGLKAYRNEVVSSLDIYGEMHRYIPVLAKWNGFRISELAVEHRARKYGRTKFGLSRFIYGFLDLLTVVFISKYMKRPMHFFGSLGILSFISGLSINAYLTFEKIVNDMSVSNRPILFLGMLLMILGVLFFTTGLLGEMITKSFSRSEPYLIKETVNLDLPNT
ncbi:glycosyl transferase family 2 [Chloroherpeton thalassium ATCC 35110]|uniref:Glycosyl transferase family 2 n=1 Tax=Chloroherpeton thalassium (strain ATCC 35110 / GB-78) TaxID=517418 RepID=B3QXD0_CHLT3|nr:glycosyltransferase family 2 protein [Chloroherpeton thalassium]ACF13404.1 glycosyl transferase family 2 [Chloroherpeton thalassium ATCC 35110]